MPFVLCTNKENAQQTPKKYLYPLNRLVDYEKKKKGGWYIIYIFMYLALDFPRFTLPFRPAEAFRLPVILLLLLLLLSASASALS